VFQVGNLHKVDMLIIKFLHHQGHLQFPQELQNVPTMLLVAVRVAIVVRLELQTLLAQQVVAVAVETFLMIHFIQLPQQMF